MSAIKTAWMLDYFGVALDEAATANAAKYDRGWFKPNQANLVTPASVAPPVDWDGVKADYLDPIHAENPDQLIGLYISGATAFNRPWDPGWAFTDSDQRLHKSNGDPLVYNDGTFDVYTWVDYGRDGVRSDHLAQYRAFCETYGFHSLFLDSWLPSFYASCITSLLFTETGGLLEGPYHTVAPWIDWLGTWTPELRAGLNADGRELWVNGVAPTSYDPSDPEDVFMGDDYSNTVLYADGALMESMHRTYGEVAEFPSYIAAIRRARDLGGSLYFLTLPWIWTLGGTQPEGGVPSDATALQRYYLAVYLLVQNERTLLGHQPYAHQAYFGIDGSSNPRVYRPDPDDWLLDFGAPTGHHVDGATTRLWWRRYTNGYAVVNPTGATLTFREPGNYRLWEPDSGPIVTIGPEATSWYAVPPRTGVFLFFRLGSA